MFPLSSNGKASNAQVVRRVLICLFGVYCAHAVKKADVKGPDFPLVEIMVTAIISFSIAGMVGGVAAWKSSQIDHAAEKTFEAIGKCLGTHPGKFLLGSLIVVLPLGYGMGLQEAELDPARLWVPVGSVAIDHKDYAMETWPSDSTPAFFLTTGEDNMLSPTALAGLKMDWDVLMALKVDGQDVIDDNEGDAKKNAEETVSGIWTFDGRGNTKPKCYRFGKNCAFNSILHVFGYSSTKYDLDFSTADKIKAHLKAWDKAPKNTLVAGVNMFKTFDLDAVLGGIERDSNGDVVSAEAIMTSMFFTSNDAKLKVHKSDRSPDDRDAITYLWEADAGCHLGLKDKHPYSEDSCGGPPSGLQYTGFLARSFTDEFGDAIAGDISKVAISYLLIIIYLFLNLGKRDKVHSMIAMSGATLVVIGFAFVASSGFGGIFASRRIR